MKIAVYRLLCGFSILSVLSSCKPGDTTPLVQPEYRKYFANERLSVKLHETVQVTDTDYKELNPLSNKLENPVFLITYDSVLKDDRVFDGDCDIVFRGEVFSSITIMKYNLRTTDTFEYAQCISHDYALVTRNRYMVSGRDTLFMYKTHPVALPPAYKKESGGYSLEMILKN